ncbi:MAG: hypothetical protein U0231_09365 [Nitrospiraceae bacterium]
MAHSLIVVMVFASQTVTLYFGPRFEQAAVPLQLLVPGVFAFSLARVMRPVIQAHGLGRHPLQDGVGRHAGERGAECGLALLMGGGRGIGRHLRLIPGW